MIKDTGGPAFPNAHFNNVNGMTLRDYFAAKAMQAIISQRGDFADANYDSPVLIASASYMTADAMLKARGA